jgi:molybdopterin converting factor small subunit
VTVKVLFYGRLAELIAPELDVNTAPGCSVADLRDRLIADHPEAEPTLRSKRSRACVGDSVVHEQFVLSEADRVEFLPPVSGG